MRSKSAAIGNVPEHWHVGPLRDALDLITYGFTNPMPDSDEGPWKLTAKDIVDGRIRYETARRTTEIAFRTLLTDKSRPCVGDVLLTKDGSIGRVAVVDREGLCINWSVALLRPNGRIHPRFLSFLLRAPYYQQRMEGDSDGSTIKHIYITRVDKMEIALPPMEEQVECLALLGALDDRIDLLRQSNATLKSIAQALFKSWFTDFDPVRAKAEGREPEGMDAATAALFPAEFEESALGLIPKGWRVGTVADAVDINPARTLSKGTEARYLEMANAPTAGHRPTERVGFRPFGSGCKFRNGDALLAKITPCLENGKGAFVDFLDEGEVGWGSTEFIVLRSKPVLPQFGAYLLTRHEPFRQFAIQAMTGTSGRQRVELSRLAQFSMALPPDSAIARAAESVLGSLQARIAANDEQAKTLADLRDTLLPRLISGKLRLPEAEEQVEAALA